MWGGHNIGEEGGVQEFLAGLGVEAIDESFRVGDIKQAVVDGRQAKRATEVPLAPFIRRGKDAAAEVPHETGILVDRGLGIEDVVHRGQIAGLRSVDAPKVAGPNQVFRSPVNADADLAVMDAASRIEEPARTA